MLEPETLKRLVKDAGLTPAGDIRFLGDGCDNDNYVVDGRWVLRIPKRPEVEARLAREVQLLEALAPELEVEVPRPLGLFRSAGHDTQYTLYPYLHGTSAETAKVDWGAAAEILGGVLSVLQRFSVRRAEGMGIDREHDAIADWAPLIERAHRSIPDVIETLRPGALDVERLPENPPAADHVLLHNDLWAEHFLVDDETGRITAVIDWADAAIGEPALDLGGLIGLGGMAFVRDLIAHASLDIDPATLERARFFALVAGLHSIDLGRSMNRPAWAKSGARAVRNSGHLR